MNGMTGELEVLALEGAFAIMCCEGPSEKTVEQFYRECCANNTRRANNGDMHFALFQFVLAVGEFQGPYGVLVAAPEAAGDSRAEAWTAIGKALTFSIAVMLAAAFSGFGQRIWNWLEGRRAATTHRRYPRARDNFALWQAQLGFEAKAMAPEHLDVMLAKFVLEADDDFDTSVSRQHCIDLVASTQQRAGHPCRLAQQFLKAWGKVAPPVQAEAMPASLAFAMVTTLTLVLKEPRAGVLVLLAFTGCLNIGEALNLRTQDVFLPRPGSGNHRGVLILRTTKKNSDQRVVLENRRVVNALLQYQKMFAPTDQDALFADMTYSKFVRLFKKALLVLRVPQGKWTTHCLRRGSATAMMEHGYSFEFVRVFGRWASESSCRECIRLGAFGLGKFH